MTIEPEIPLLDTILSGWKATIGDDYQGYRNHVYRMVHFCLALRACSEQERQKVIIAGVFHDIGLWVGNTFDYIAPSLPPMEAYLEREGLEQWSEEIGLMITEHHRLRAVRSETYPLVEVFRQGDLVDFSLGAIQCGLPAASIRAVKAQFPNAGFHAGLARKAATWALRHPLNPLPMVKW